MNKDKLYREYEKALILRGEGNYRAAKDILSELAKESPESFLVHLVLGHCYWKLGEIESAENAFQNAVVLKPLRRLASLGLFHSLWDQGKHENALMELKRFQTLSHCDEYFEMLLAAQDDWVNFDESMKTAFRNVFDSEDKNNSTFSGPWLD